MEGTEGALSAPKAAAEASNGDDGDEQSRVSVDDDGASGVGAAAAAAVSVAVARSWTSAAHKVFAFSITVSQPSRSRCPAADFQCKGPVDHWCPRPVDSSVQAYLYMMDPFLLLSDRDHYLFALCPTLLNAVDLSRT